MTRNERKQLGAALLCAVVLAGLPLLTACSSKSATPKGANVVQVQLTDQGIQMPATLPSGVTTFQVANAGTSEHSFAVTGPSGDLKLEAPLKPGESGSLDIVLDPGTYRVFNPLNQNGGAMQIALNVRPESAHSRNG